MLLQIRTILRVCGVCLEIHTRKALTSFVVDILTILLNVIYIARFVCL